MNISISFMSIVISVIASMVIGSIWYGPLFGKTWKKLMGRDMGSKNSVVMSYILMMLGSALTTYVLGHILVTGSAYTGIMGLSAGLTAGFWSWLGFAVPLSMGSQLWEGKPWKLFFINAGYQLVFLLVAGMILVTWM
jgi:hypothetical protein